VLTGLRKAELASLTVGQLELDGPAAYATLHAADEKARRGAKVPLRADLAADLRAWLGEKLAAAQDRARGAGQAIPFRLPADTPLFTVPAGLVRILDRDLKAAGIPKRDGRGWQVDVHAMRKTFGTLLSKGGVAPRTAQAAMRHSDLRLTMGVYTDPRLLDVAGALDALPALPLDGVAAGERQRARATGTDGALAPTLAPTSALLVQAGAMVGRAGGSGGDVGGDARPGVSARADNGKRPPSFADSGRHSQRAMRLELTTSTLATLRSTTELRPHGRPEATGQ